jgi:hypothetical protein
MYQIQKAQDVLNKNNFLIFYILSSRSFVPASPTVSAGIIVAFCVHPKHFQVPTARTARFSNKSLRSDVGEIKKMSEKLKKKSVLTPRNVREESNTVIYYKTPTLTFKRREIKKWDINLLDYLRTLTRLSPIRLGCAPGFVSYKKGCTRLAAASDKVYQLPAHGWWFSLRTPASSITKTGRHDIAEILLKVALNTIN